MQDDSSIVDSKRLQPDATVWIERHPSQHLRLFLLFTYILEYPFSFEGTKGATEFGEEGGRGEAGP